MAKNKPGTQPLTVIQIFEHRHQQPLELKQGEGPARNRCQMELEQLHQHAREILRMSTANDGLTSEQAKFLATLFSFHATREKGTITLGDYGD